MNPLDTNTISSSRIGLELDGPFGLLDWCLLTAAEPERAAQDLADALDGAGVAHEILVADNPEALVTALPGVRACIVTGAWNWGTAAYETLDRLRSAVRDSHSVLLWVTTPAAAQALVRHAPNFAAFFAPSMGAWSDGSMSSAEAETHLVALRARHEMSDAEVLSLAEKGEMASDADHHAWLILLGRGDLIAQASRHVP